MILYRTSLPNCYLLTGFGGRRKSEKTCRFLSTQGGKVEPNVDVHTLVFSIRRQLRLVRAFTLG